MGATDPKGEGGYEAPALPVDWARIPEKVREHVLYMSRCSTYARVARSSWLRKRDAYKANGVADSVGEATTYLWDAEARLERAAEEYRVLLRAREAMPASERWAVAALGAWLRSVLAASSAA